MGNDPLGSVDPDGMDTITAGTSAMPVGSGGTATFTLQSSGGWSGLGFTFGGSYGPVKSGRVRPFYQSGPSFQASAADQALARFPLPSQASMDTVAAWADNFSFGVTQLFGRDVYHRNSSAYLAASAAAIGASFLMGEGEVNAAGQVGKRAYSVAFETIIPKIGAGTRQAHFKAANAALAAAMREDAGIAKIMDELGIKIGGMDKSPQGWSWHHLDDTPGGMQLVPRSQHESPLLRPLFHPNKRGAFSTGALIIREGSVDES